MKLYGLPNASSTTPTPLAGTPPVLATPRIRPAPADSIAPPHATPTIDPARSCPDTSHDRSPQAMAVGLVAAAAIPLLPVIGEGLSLEAFATVSVARLGSGSAAAADFAATALRAYAGEAAPLVRGFATREEAAKTIGAQAWKATDETAHGVVTAAGMAGGDTLARHAIDAVEAIAQSGGPHRSR